MRTLHTLIRGVAALQLALVLPAALFLAAVLVGLGDPPQYELARVAQRIASWYSGRMWTLWLLLLALPFAALVAGCATLLGSWKPAGVPPGATPPSLGAIPAPLATLVVAGTTLTSAGILAVVVLHMLAN